MRTTRNPLVRELIREQFANKPNLLFLGIFANLAYFGGYFEKNHEFNRIFREIITKSSLISHNILGELFANSSRTSETVRELFH